MKNDVTSIPDHKHHTRQLVIISLMTAIICIIAPFSVPIPMSPVPLSLTNFMIFITVYVLGIRYAAFCVILYLILGAVGLPVFSSFSGGLGKLAGPTGGYLIGFIFLALIQGLFVRLFSGNTYAAIMGMILGMTVCYIFGTAWLAWQLEQSFTASLAIGVLPYLPGDAAKIIAAAIAGPKLRAVVLNI